MKKESRYKGFHRTVAWVLAAAAIFQMVSVAFSKPNKK